MVTGIGIDVQTHEELRLPLDDPFFARCYTLAELDQARERTNPTEYLAGRFAAKEAVVKAFGIDTDRVRLTDIEVLDGPAGAPSCRLRGDLGKLAQAHGLTDALVSISHAKGLSTAMALLQSSGETTR